MTAVLITGGAGFIGSHVADAYLAAGFEVTVLDNLSTGRRENVPARADFVRADIGSPEARELLAAGGFAVLNHHAAQMDVRVSVADPAFDARTNLLGLLNLLEGARAGGVTRIVFASSGGVVYDDRGTLPHVETSRKLPLSPYGVSKIGSEYYLAAYARLYGLAVVSLRYANVYGPRQNPHGEAGVVAIFGKKLTTGDPLLIYGDGEQTRDYVYVGDVAQANLAATRAAAPVVDCLDDPAFNIGTGRETSVNELARLLMAGAGRSVPIRHEAARPGELARSALNCAKAGEAWGWRPGMSIAEGLKRTYDWILEAAA